MATPDYSNQAPQGGPITLGNKSVFVPPSFNSMPGWYPYADLYSQMADAVQGWSKGAGVFANNNNPQFNSVMAFKPNVGGGLLGTTAYAGTGAWNPYAGRGNGPGGGPVPGAYRM